MNPSDLRFDSQEPKKRGALTGQRLRVWDAMKDGQWRTLAEIESITGDQAVSISSVLRHFRKQQHGGHTVNRRIIRTKGMSRIYEYQLEVK